MSMSTTQGRGGYFSSWGLHSPFNMRHGQNGLQDLQNLTTNPCLLEPSTPQSAGPPDSADPSIGWPAPISKVAVLGRARPQQAVWRTQPLPSRKGSRPSGWGALLFFPSFDLASTSASPISSQPWVPVALSVLYGPVCTFSGRPTWKVFNVRPLTRSLVALDRPCSVLPGPGLQRARGSRVFMDQS